jgi:hypothetical protein
VILFTNIFSREDHLIGGLRGDAPFEEQEEEEEEEEHDGHISEAKRLRRQSKEDSLPRVDLPAGKLPVIARPVTGTATTSVKPPELQVKI